jgi:LuxR family transcriptional regulator
MDSQFLGQIPQLGFEPVYDARAHDLASYASHLSATLHATDQETVWALTSTFFRDLGFAHAMYGYSPDSWGPKLGAPEDYLVLSTFSAEVSAEMVTEGHFLQSLTFHWALQNVGVASWSKSMADCGVGPDFVVNPVSLEFFARHGFVSGCSIGFPNERTRGNAVMALIAPPTAEQSEVDDWLESHHEIIFVAATVAHSRLSTLPYCAPRRSLTARQREVLEWVAEGKTSADIATIMGISPPTVDKHLRLARETLGVDTTAHALIKAAFLNQVFVTERPEAGVGVPDPEGTRRKKPRVKP